MLRGLKALSQICRKYLYGPIKSMFFESLRSHHNSVFSLVILRCIRFVLLLQMRYAIVCTLLLFCTALSVSVFVP